MKSFEVKRVDLWGGGDMGNIKDVNGNNVGTFYGDFELDDEE